MIGAFGSVISLCQLLVLERTEWASGELYVSVLERGASQAGLGLSRGCHRNNAGVWALIAGFVVCLFAMYNTTSVRSTLLVRGNEHCPHVCICGCLSCGADLPQAS